MRVYFDNAATTPLDPQVMEAMMPYFQQHYGNPSSIHTHGREARAALDKARKTVANYLHAATSEIFFTSGGTEADNTAIISAIRSNGIRHAITSPLEHHAVLHTLEAMQKAGEIRLSKLALKEKGELDLVHLEKLLEENPSSFVSLMHGNNEIGNLLDIEAVAILCKQYGALFHSDTVQTMGHYSFDLQQNAPDFIAASAHKFHGPKGVGFLYINANTKIHPYLHGGGQERNMRGGTENVYGIVGLAKAMEIAYTTLEEQKRHILQLKSRMIAGLKENIPGVKFNGLSEDLDKSLYTVLSVAIPDAGDDDMLIFNLDINKISASAGSACSSGTNIGSHVLQAIKADEAYGHIRFSFSKYNTVEEVDYVLEKLKSVKKL
ncbi:MAG TPA: cysteine desulfurase family protein [Cytophagaceae bacterium]|jgi:cysteine desulfurase|nr:cysteine desulfurase family protein [Cytophagaceae bacterium]